MQSLTPTDAAICAAIRIALAQLGAEWDRAALWHVGERHTDDDREEWEEPRMLRDARLGSLLSLPQQRD